MTRARPGHRAARLAEPLLAKPLPTHPPSRQAHVGGQAWRRTARGVFLPLCLGALACCLGACTHTYAGRLKTRDPLDEARPDRYRSGTIVLGIGDVDVRDFDGRRVLLTQSAWFEITSEDELRFHVLVSHKQEDMARLEGYSIRLRTDTGEELAPAAVLTRRTLVERHDATIAQVKPGAFTHSTPTYSEETISRDLHGGEGVIVFKRQGLVSKRIRSYTLLLDSRKRRLRFTWDLVPKAELGDEE